MRKCAAVVVSLRGCGIVLCVGCLIGSGCLWSSTCIITLLRLRGPLVDVCGFVHQGCVRL